MIEVQELLRRKENELARVRREIEALRTVTPLLSEPDDIADLQPGPNPHASPLPLEASFAEENVLQDTSSPDSDEVLFHSISPKRSRLRDWIGRAVGEQRQVSELSVTRRIDDRNAGSAPLSSLIATAPNSLLHGAR